MRGGCPELRSAAREVLPAFEHDQAFDVVCQVGEADFDASPGDADRSDEQPHPALLLGEDVLDPDPAFDFRPFARATFTGIGRPGGFLRWTRDTKPLAAMNASFSLERYATSAQTGPAVLVLSSSPSRSTRPPLLTSATRPPRRP